MDARVPDNTSGTGSLLLRRALLAALVGTLAVLCVLVLRPFLAPIVWAVILAYVTWPWYRRLRVAFRTFNTAAASVMTLLVTALAIAPVLWLLMLMQHELVDAYRRLTVYLSQGPHDLPAGIRDIPWFGDWLQESLDRYATDPAALAREITTGLQRWRGEFGALLGGVSRNLGKLLIALMTLFFFYRDGDLLVRQIRNVEKRLFDVRLDRYVRAAGAMTRAVVYQLLITALAQGVIAGIGYWILGLEAPVVLGALTGLLSTAPPLGTAFIWVPAALGLMVAGHVWKGVLLLAWGSLLIHPTDNLLRAVLISSVTQVPFLLVMLGALGGLVAFGLVGVFVGPIVLGVASALWREWATDAERIH
jgi:predicted PurR-regulated permease PerM